MANIQFVALDWAFAETLFDPKLDFFFNKKKCIYIYIIHSEYTHILLRSIFILKNPESFERNFNNAKEEKINKKTFIFIIPLDNHANTYIYYRMIVVSYSFPDNDSASTNVQYCYTSIPLREKKTSRNIIDSERVHFFFFFMGQKRRNITRNNRTTKSNFAVHSQGKQVQ